MCNKLKIASISLSIFFFVCTLPASAVEPNEVLHLAEKTANWITSTSVKQTVGIAWPDNNLKPQKIGYDLGTGASGTVVYFVALYRATGKKIYLEQAKQGANYLVSLINTPDAFKENAQKTSLYKGIPGIGVALIHVLEETQDSKYREALKSIISMLEQWSVLEENQRHWSVKFNDLLYGDTGTVLFLSDYATHFNDTPAKRMSEQGANFLLSIAKNSSQGSYWLFRRDKPFNLPNFSHGTAGVMYTLATVGERSKNNKIIAGAKSAYSYLQSIAKIEANTIAMPYGWGNNNWKGLYEFGWAHGLTGVAFALERLGSSGFDGVKTDKLLNLIQRTLTGINLPEKPSPPFSEPSLPLDARFGRAGVLSLMSYWSAKHPNEQSFTRVRDNIWLHIKRAAIEDDIHAHWKVAAPSFMGGGEAEYSGILHGSSGIGMALLAMHSSMTNKNLYSDLPDAPF
jgi:hypothetical protein